jgi:hypothetical protein
LLRRRINRFIQVEVLGRDVHFWSGDHKAQ